MCVLILCRDIDPGFPLVLAANREEDPARPTHPPGLHLVAGRRVLCPEDRRHGGTWLGVNDAGVLAALTNFAGATVVPGAHSRGEIALRALAAPDAEAAMSGVHLLLAGVPVRPFRLVVADARRTLYLEAPGGTVREVHDRLLVLTNRHAPGALEVAGLTSWAVASAASPSDIDARLDHLVVVLATARGIDQATGEPIPLCIDEGIPRTVSSALIAVPAELASLRFSYSPGSPRTQPFRDYSGLARRLVGPL
jgi:hypothetical protein